MKVLNFNDPYIDSKGNVNNLGDMLSGELASQLVTNLLNPTLQSQVLNGVTCTNNGDGTFALFTLNGPSTAVTTFDNSIYLNAGKYKIVGCPAGGEHDKKYEIQVRDTSVIYGYDTGEGANFTIPSNGTYNVRIRVASGITLNNLIFKPMITTDLSATYDDFVAYTGSSGTLNGDVAEIVKKFKLDNAKDITFAYDSGNLAITFKVSDTNYRRIYLNNNYITFSQSTDGSTWSNIWVK